MKICIEPDFLYYQDERKAELTVKSCGKACAFCPAGSLKDLINPEKLQETLDFNINHLVLKGDPSSKYIEYFISKLRNSSLTYLEVHSCKEKFIFNTDYTKLWTHYELPLLDTVEFQVDEIAFLGFGDPFILSLMIEKYKSLGIKFSVELPEFSNPLFSKWDQKTIEEFKQNFKNLL